jgi:hypothetical protein
MSPSGEVVTRWDPDMPWQLVGGTNDGDTVPEGEVEGWTELVPARPGTASTVSGAEGVAGYRPLEAGEQARHTEELARVMREAWLSGEPIEPGGRIDWLRFAHAVERRLTGLNDWEPGPADPFAQVSAVDTRLEHLVGVWLRRTQNDDPRLADKLMNDVAAVVRGA